MTRPDVSDERIPQILDAAAHVFSQFGIDSASMSQIAEACQLSKATIYHYFDSKEALVIELVKRLFKEDQVNLESIVTDSSPALFRLKTYAQKLTHLLDQNRILSPILTEFHARAMRDQHIHRIIREYYDRYLRVFKSVIDQGIAHGEIRPDHESYDIALAYLAIIEGSVLLAQNSGKSINNSTMTSMAVFLEGLLN